MKKHKKTVVFGGRGMLGTDLCSLLTDAGGTLLALDLPEFDIRDASALRQVMADADIIVNCAAYTNVDGAESERDTAWQVNAEALERIAETAVMTGSYVLHLSTDFVFDGKLERPYRETDPPAPLSEYGKSKLAGERALLQSDARAAVVRLQWTYGGHGRHFISKILEKAAAGGPLTVVTDQIGSPTWTLDVSRALLELIKLQGTGLYHYAAADSASRFEVAAFVLRTLNLEVPLRPCLSTDFECAAERPLNSRFDCSKLDTLLGSSRPHWQDSLRKFLLQDG